jgi:hypothetical protein
MADINAPMAPADHVLCNAALVLSLTRHPEPGRLDMIRDILARAAEHPGGGSAKVEAVRLAALAVIRLPRDPIIALRLEQALADWAEWRLGLALDRRNAA